MATRVRVQPPTRPDGNEPIKYTCDECGAKDIEAIDTHVYAQGHDNHLIIDHRFIQWYAKDRV